MDEGIIREMRRYTRMMTREFGLLADRLGDAGIGMAQYQAMIELEHGPHTVKSLAEVLCVDKSNASRALSQLVGAGLCDSEAAPDDKRVKNFFLTPEGFATLERFHIRADIAFEELLGLLGPHERDYSVRGLRVWSQGLRYARMQEEYSLRTIRQEDNLAMGRIIREVSEEYGLRAEDGFAVGDPETDALFEAYRQPGTRYWVVERDGLVVGGAGIGRLVGGGSSVCELQKMYLLSECRGVGLGRRLVNTALAYARKCGYTYCYLETTERLEEATALYRKMGFAPTANPMGETGHSSCCELHFLCAL